MITDYTGADHDAAIEFDAEQADKSKACLDTALAEQVYLAKVLISIRDKMVIFADEIEDEGDRVYLGSSNHKDEIEDILEILNEVQWMRVHKDAKPRDLYADLRFVREELVTCERRRRVVEASLDDIVRTGSSVLTGISIHNALAVDAPRRRMNIEGEVISEFTDAVHAGRMLLRGEQS